MESQINRAILGLGIEVACVSGILEKGGLPLVSQYIMHSRGSGNDLFSIRSLYSILLGEYSYSTPQERTRKRRPKSISGWTVEKVPL